MTEQKELDTALVRAVYANDYDYVGTLVLNGANINCYDGNPLKLAVRISNIAMIKLLILCKADVTIDFNAAIHLAVERGEQDIVDLLLKHGARL